MTENYETHQEAYVIRAGGNGFFTLLKCVEGLLLVLAVLLFWKRGLEAGCGPLLFAGGLLAFITLLSTYRIKITSAATVIIIAPWRRKRTIPLRSVTSALIDWERGNIRPNILIEYTSDGKKRHTRIPWCLFNRENLQRLLELFDATLPDDESEES